MGTRNFSFKQFEIQQDACGMKVSQDACLFGAWATFLNPKHLLDIGAGTGLLSLMLAQRYACAQIDAVEIDAAAAQQCSANFTDSPWAERLRLHYGSIQKFALEKTYDGIICNPPFFPNHLPATNLQRNRARHTVALPFQDLCQQLMRLLKPQGKACLLLAAEQSPAFQAIALKEGLHLTETLYIRSRAHKPPHRVLLSFCPTATLPFPERELCVHAEGSAYSTEFCALLQDFYLFL